MSRRIVAVTAAVVLALLGTVAVLGYVRSADTRALAGQQAVEVYVAKKVVPAGTTFRSAVDDNLIVQEAVAQKAVPDTVVPTVTPSTESLVAVSDIQPGELVLSGRFAAQQAATSSGLAIPDGLMAVSVALADPARVGQFVTAGSEIAVFDTFNIQTAVKGQLTPSGDHLADDFDKTRATRLLLPRVKVLAVGATTTVTKSDSSSSSSSSQSGSGSSGQQLQQTLLTVAVTQAQAEALVQGIQTGTLYLALLTPSSKVDPGPGVTDRDLFATR